ncbi:MAG: CPBP family intramembrane glutamic endopeptidase, partial [Clostridium sp.]
GSDKLIFAKYLPPKIEAYTFLPTYFIGSILYGGVVEEVMLRLFVMSLIVLILWKIFARSRNNSTIPNLIYITAIFISAILFAAGHLPVTAQTLGLSTPILIRCFLLNGIGGIGFGYLYWKRGLSYAIYAHMITHIFMQLVFMPILF